MDKYSEKIDLLFDKLSILLKKQETFSDEINNLRAEINRLKDRKTDDIIVLDQTIKEKSLTEEEFNLLKIDVITKSKKNPIKRASKPYKISKSPFFRIPKIKLDLEKFIGENLINKIGIIVTVLGVSIGAKYTIDNNLISPLWRIVLGYLAGFVLLGFGINLKKKYVNYSAVLISGSMAILYFITYAAYNFYALMPIIVAFVLMAVITCFTVVAAIKYNSQVIALIGLVGAYAVPFLLSEDSGEVVVLFTYITIINLGILVIAYWKYWKLLFYSSMGLTWLIYSSWYETSYQSHMHFEVALLFLSIFFIIFYLTDLAYKWVQKEKFDSADILLFLFNSFVFYGLGYSILSNHQTGEQFLGLFTLANALIHTVVSIALYQKKIADKNLFYFICGLALVFITVAIPVQLNGNWVSILWIGEAVLLYWIGRTKNAAFYEKLSYPLMFLAFISIGQDWTTVYGDYDPDLPDSRVTPILNIHFLSSLLFIAGFGFIYLLKQNKNYPSKAILNDGVSKLISILLPGILIFVIYYSIRIELATYWDQQYADSLVSINTEGQPYPRKIMNFDYLNYKTIWIINYSLLFVSLLSFLNIKKIKNLQLGIINLGLNTVAIVVFLLEGLLILGNLLDNYLEQNLSEYFPKTAFNIGIRYISYAFLVITLIASFRYVQKDGLRQKFSKAFDVLLHASVLWILSDELINWMEIATSTESYKIGLSVLWGSYALFLICFGIWKRKKHIRISAIVLFGATLIKLFFYDISHLDTMSKTIVFVSLGILLLIISFLYNKYKSIISNEREE